MQPLSRTTPRLPSASKGTAWCFQPAGEVSPPVVPPVVGSPTPPFYVQPFQSLPGTPTPRRMLGRITFRV